MIWDFIIDIFNMLIKGVSELAKLLVMILPNSPFITLNNSGVIKYMGWLNWLIPVSTMISIGIGWLSAISVYYIVSVGLRWAKVID